MARHYAGRLCDQIGIRAKDIHRWGLMSCTGRRQRSVLTRLDFPAGCTEQDFSLTSKGYPSILMIPNILGS